MVLLILKGGSAYFAHPAADNRLAAEQLAALAGQANYSAVAFVENTGLNYTIEEQTPWGMRLYLDKPIYGIAWRLPQSGIDLCRAVRVERSLLVVVDPSMGPAALQSALANCHAHSVHVGTWRRSALELIHA